MSVEFDWDVAGDAELVGAAAGGYRVAFAGIYDRYADRLFDFCVGIVGHHDAADCVQEAFCTAVTDLPSLRDPHKLRPWLYAIARHQALRSLRARRRETTSDQLPDEPSAEAGPDTLAARNELATLIEQAEGGISDRDREILDLAYRHGLTGAELAQALGVSNDSAKKMVQRLRDTIARSLGALLIARQATAGLNRCPELATVVAGWDGEFTILVRKRISRHIESCANCDEHRHRLVNPVALLGGAPVFIPAPSWLRDHTLNQMARAPIATTSTAGTGAHTGGHLAAVLTGRLALWAAAIVAVPAVALAVTVGLPAVQGGRGSPVPVSPALPSTSESQAASGTPVGESNTPPQQPSTSLPPSVAPPISDEPNGTTPGTDPVPQSPAPVPVATLTPQKPTAARPSPVTPATPASNRPDAAPSQEPTKPRVEHCPNGDTVTAGDICPTPQSTSSTKAPAPPSCQHVAVQDAPVCGRTGP